MAAKRCFRATAATSPTFTSELEAFLQAAINTGVCSASHSLLAAQFNFNLISSLTSFALLHVLVTLGQRSAANGKTFAVLRCQINLLLHAVQ